MKRSLGLIFLSLIPIVLIAQSPIIDSIQEFRKLSKDGSFTYQERLDFALKSVELSINTRLDSTVLKSNIVLSGAYLNLDDYENYKKVNLDNLEYANKLNDSSSIAYANHQLGWYYDYSREMYDSAYYYYYNAQKLYRELDNRSQESAVLVNMTIIQKDEGDYVGAEKNAIEALELVQSLEESDDKIDTLWSLNTLLAGVSNRLKDYEVALTYYSKTLDLANKHSSPYYYLMLSKNNIGNTYNSLKRYDEALILFQELVDDKELKSFDPNLYVLALINLARTKFLMEDEDYEEVLSIFRQAYKISDSSNNTIGKIGTLSYMSDFYFTNKELDASLNATKEAYSLSKKIGSNEFILRSLKRMSEIEKGELGIKHLNEYIKLSDSLLDNERAIRNKFARIEFETDQIRAEKDKATRERLIFMISSIALLVTLFMLYIIITQRIKNKELAFAQQQQEANEEIYNLMLAQQDKIDEGRTQEKRRISEELHDGILGRLFGTRLSLDSLNFQSTDEAVKTRGQYIDELKSIEQEIRKISHDLNADFVSGRSFTDILETLVETQTQAYQLSYTYDEDDDIDWEMLTNKTKIHIYRMLQETMQNTYKHANAKHINISFRLKNNVILLTVIDDGEGFNLNKARKGIGLKNFESRAKEIKGKVNIKSNPGAGTEVQIEIPVK